MKSLGKMLGSALLAMVLVGCAGDRYSRSTGEVIDDAAIITKAKAALINDPIVSGSSIDVDVNRGIVTLTGAVNGEVAKKKAYDIVAGINGVRSVQNNLLVRDNYPYESTGAPAEGTSGENREPVRDPVEPNEPNEP